MKTKLEAALEKAQDDQEEFDIVFKTSVFYNRHLMDIIDLDDKHNFLTAREKAALRKLAKTLEDGIMEKISELRSGLNNYRNSDLY